MATIDLYKAMKNAGVNTPRDIARTILDLISKLLEHPGLTDEKKERVAQLRAFIDIHFRGW